MSEKFELPAELMAELEALAKEKGTSLANYVENSIRWALKNRRELDPLFAKYEPYTGETPSDLSSNHDDYLYGDGA